MDRALRLYLIVVITAGFGWGAFHVAGDGLRSAPIAILLLLSALTIAGELSPIRMERAGQQSAITVSTTFSFAALLIIGPLAAIVAQGLASLIDDIKERKTLWKSAFNISQYAISLSLTGLTLSLFVDTIPSGGIADFTVSDLGAIGLAALAFLLTNHLLVGIAVTLAQHKPLLTYLRESFSDLMFAGWGDLILMSLSPIILVAAHEHLLLVPLMAIPLVAVHKSVKVSFEKAELIGVLQVQAEENEYQATHDFLTGLPNRLLFKQRLEVAIEESQAKEQWVGVMMMDLDRFKEVNDALGHHAGDDLLKEISTRLLTVIRSSDTVGRLSGDEFAVVVANITSHAEAAAVAERVLSVFEESFELKGVRLHLNASIGIALYPEQAHDASSLLQRADVAMYQAKGSGSGYEFYSAEHDSSSPARLTMVDDLRRAISDGGLKLQYQPKVDHRDQRLVGVEALVRWEHPRRGTIAPGEFIELAEQAGLIGALTDQVTVMAVEQSAAWRSDGYDVNIAINLSLQSVMNLELPSKIAATLRRFQVPPSAITLEITESCMMADPTRTTAVLNTLDDMGIRLSVDDFGTGYSSLSYLRKLPVTEIKIDRSFIMEMMSDESNRVIAASTIDLGRNLGMQVVAEGVASAEILNELDELGCRIMQGFYIGRPMDPDALMTFFMTSAYKPDSLNTRGQWQPTLIRGRSDELHPAETADEPSRVKADSPV